MKTKELFDLRYTDAAGLLDKYESPWEAVPVIREFITSLFDKLSPEVYDELSNGVWVAKSASIAESASIAAPCIIGEMTEVRHCAYIRGGVLVGRGCVVGNSCEIKNSILFDKVQVPHFNYVGDSILGFASHLGAGAVTSNVKSDRSDIFVTDGGMRVNTHRHKLGAMIGDNAEVGCGAVLCPGTVIGKGSTVYPLASVRGTVPPRSIYKARDNIIEKY